MSYTNWQTFACDVEQAFEDTKELVGLGDPESIEWLRFKSYVKQSYVENQPMTEDELYQAADDIREDSEGFIEIGIDEQGLYVCLAGFPDF